MPECIKDYNKSKNINAFQANNLPISDRLSYRTSYFANVA